MLTGKQLRLLRQSSGLMQKQLADKMDIAQQRLSALEKKVNKISDSCVDKALKVLNFTREDANRFLNNLPVPARED